MYKFQEFYIPERMMGGIERYIKRGIPPGSFLKAIITNDLKNVVGQADSENMKNIPAFVAYFYNNAPFGCWGSREKYLNWMKKRKEKGEFKND